MLKHFKYIEIALLDNNVSVTALKNLIIDKPAPITTKLAQTHGGIGCTYYTIEYISLNYKK